MYTKLQEKSQNFVRATRTYKTRCKFVSGSLMDVNQLT